MRPAKSEWPKIIMKARGLQVKCKKMKVESALNTKSNLFGKEKSKTRREVEGPLKIKNTGALFGQAIENLYFITC